MYGENYGPISNIGPLKEYPFPLNLSSIHKISGQDLLQIPFSPHSRLKCQNCGLFNRGTLCPPRLGNTYPQLKTIKGARAWFRQSKEVWVIVWKNDGTKPWIRDWKELSHICFKEVGGRRLKGIEHASAKAITKFMKELETKINDIFGKRSCFAFIPGHCDLCGRYCPLRENKKAHCKKGGMPSMESTGIDVYRLLTILGVDWNYPVMDSDPLTQVTALSIRR